MATKSLDEVKDRFYEEGLVWAPAQTMLEVTDDPQLVANGYIIEYDHPKEKRFRSIDSPIKLSGCPNKIRQAAPELGQDTDAVLLELGYVRGQIQELRGQQVIF